MQNTNPLQWVLPHIRQIKPYSSARDEFQGTAQIFLDANENALGPLGSNYNRYPDPHALELKTEVSKWLAVHENQLFLGNGSDEAIDLVFRAICEPGKHKAIILPPTYGMYQVSAAINRVELVQIPLNDAFQPDVEAILQAQQQDPDIRLLFICSPNNPTGNLIEQDRIRQLVEHFNGFIVVDEAYLDFSTQPSVAQWLQDLANVLIIKTLSKAWGLANIRLGIAIGHPEFIEVLNRIKPPYNLSGLTQSIALDALRHHKAAYSQSVSTLVEYRGELAGQLAKLKLIEKVYTSSANFLLVKIIALAEAKKIYNQLITKGIVVRDRSNQINCNNCLRITVGTSEENARLLSALEEINNAF